MKIAVFGGTFDPPHVGHLHIAKALIEKMLVDEVWFVPVWQHPLGKSVQHTHHRLEMLKVMIKDQPQMRLELFEIEQGGVSYTYRTMKALQVAHPEHELVFVMGSDNLQSFSKWYEYQALSADFEILVYPRAGYELEPRYPHMQPLYTFPMVATSSTEVRTLASEGKAIDQLVVPAVARYIKEHSLYVTHEATNSP